MWLSQAYWCWDDRGFGLIPSLMVPMAAWEYTMMFLQCQGLSRSNRSQQQTCYHYPHLLLTVSWPPEDTPAKHPPEQMGQTPVSLPLLAWPLSFLLMRFSRALPFILGVLEVAAGAL